MHMRALAPVLLWPVLIGHISFAQEKLTPEKTPSSKYIIIYGSPSWNTSSSSINTAFLVIRDRISKKLLQVHLEETAPDSSEFRGSFQFKLTEQKKITPEVYIPPQSLRNQMEQFYQLIQNGKIARKPIIIKRTRDENIIDVYDTKDQAQRAWEAFQESQALRVQTKVPSTPAVPEPEDVLNEAEALSRKTEADKENERIRLEQIERQKIEARLAEQKKLNEAEREKRRLEALQLAEEGMEAYTAKDYPLAEEKFRKSAELDPSNKEFYYKYGVSLYKNEKYNEALVAFNVAPVEGALQTEKSYYMGLSHFKLNENKRAMDQFKIVAEANDPVLSPSALFYQGVILFNEEKYEEAKAPFEKVLDTSKDPRLDERADEYIEAIAKAQTLIKLREKRWRVSGTAGLMYDSNVLLAPDLQTTQGASQEEGDVRLVTVGDVTYKALVNENSSLDINASANLTNSSKNDLSSADPWLYTVRAPYSFQREGKKPSMITLTPAYETLFMAVDGSSTKSNILNSFLGQASYMVANQPSWLSIYNFEYRMDDFSLANSIGDDDLDAHRFTLGTTQTALIGSRKKEALAGTLRFARNEAKGKNRLYNRYELGVTYATPVWKSSTWSTSLNYYFLDFPNSTLNRKDNNVTLSSALAKPIRDWFTWGVVGSFSNNVSTVSDTYSYTRYTIMTTATFNTAF